MEEHDYCIVTNRVKVSIALNILRDVLPGPDWGVDPDELQKIIRNLTYMQCGTGRKVKGSLDQQG